MRKLWLVVAIGALVSSVPAALADAPLKSTNYQITESFIGGGGLINSSSGSYKTNESIGDIGIGNSTSTNYQTNSGYTTTADPALSFIVNTSSLNFGTLSNSSTATQTATFSVIDYTSYGYSVYAYGSTPNNGATPLANIASAAPSSIGTEQFGLNLRANSVPSGLGVDPSGGFGTYATGYGTVNSYQYNSGDKIATSAKSSGQTNFTISYIINANATTGGGVYTGNLNLICVATY
jgi:hypothetical protein